MISLNLTLLFLCCWITLYGVEGVTYRLFYPYGPETRDVKLTPSDDISSNEVFLNVSIAYFDRYYRSIYINSNGHLSFDSDMPHYRATALVLPIEFNVIAAFLADIDITNGIGDIYYRETSYLPLLQRAAADIQAHFVGKGQFEPTSLFVVTWDKVGYYRQKGDKRNTFQIVLASDGIDSFAFFYYLDNGIEWLLGEGKTPPTYDPPAQAGFNFEDGRYLKLPESGTTVAFVNETNVNIPGAWMFQIGNTDNGEVQPADLNTGEVIRVHEVETAITSCLEGTRLCHINAKCIDYESGFCCECLPSFYGNGKQCLEPGVPQRLNGKVFGSINGVELYDLDMHTYVVTSDGRAYTAISRVPPQLGVSLQTVSTIGAIIGWMYAVPTHPGAANGYVFTGGEFNRTAIVTFMHRNTTKSLKVFQEFLGHDALNNLRLETHVNGDIPVIAPNSKVTVDDYKENYRRVAPGVIKSYSTRTYRINDVAYRYTHDQTIHYKECQHDDRHADDVMRLSVSRNFVVFDNSNQVVRFAMSNKVSIHTGIDPCRDSAQNCAAHSDCIPEGQTYRCVCHTGYAGDGTICEDIDECENVSPCDQNARCFNIQGSFRCQCVSGYRGDGLQCVRDIQLCGDKECGSEARCVYNAELRTPVCECNAGFVGDGVTCNKIEFGCNEVDNCPPNSQCVYDSDEFRYKCECVDGFSGDGETGSCVSTDDRDCRNCDANAECVYGVDRFEYKCQCNAGFTGDGYTCTRLDGCALCSPHAECYSDRRTGEYQCRCKRGYYGDGRFCETYDCRTQDVCDPNAECHPDVVANTYLCRCKAGYRGDGRRCEAVGCNVLNDCSPNAQCIPDPRDGSRHMCRCNPGFEGDGRVCIQRIVPCNQVDNCHERAECVYSPDERSYRCRCGYGYEGDGYRCTRRDDVHDCHRDPAMCDANAACLWNVDRYGCVCNQGYIGDGSTCRAFDGTGNYLIYAQGYSISKVPFARDANSSGQMLVYLPGQLAVAVTTDCHSGYLYWSDVAGGLIRRSRLDGTGMETVVTGLVSPEGIAVDWVGRNIYFTDSELDVVAVARVDGSYMKTLFRDNLVNPRAIVADPRRGTIYWTDWNRSAPQIEKANMDGTEREVLIQTELGLPNGLSLDHMTQQLCWGDAGTKRIECARTDGLGRRIVYDKAPYPFDVAFFNNVIYWSDWETKGIPNINKEGGDVNDVIPLAIGGNGRTYGVTAVKDQCPRVTNACGLSNGGCRFLCLPTVGGGRTCECPDDVDPRRCNEVALLNKK